MKKGDNQEKKIGVQLSLLKKFKVEEVKHEK
jgi:hypothetical protein